MVGIETPKPPETPTDDTLCILHHFKKTYFCEDCLLELCMTCKDKHDKSHAIKLTDDACLHVINIFKTTLDDIADLRSKVNEASKNKDN